MTLKGTEPVCYWYAGFGCNEIDWRARALAAESSLAAAHQTVDDCRRRESEAVRKAQSVFDSESNKALRTQLTAAIARAEMAEAVVAAARAVVAEANEDSDIDKYSSVREIGDRAIRALHVALKACS